MTNLISYTWKLGPTMSPTSASTTINRWCGCNRCTVKQGATNPYLIFIFAAGSPLNISDICKSSFLSRQHCQQQSSTVDVKVRRQSRGVCENIWIYSTQPLQATHWICSISTLLTRRHLEKQNGGESKYVTISQTKSMIYDCNCYQY